MGLFSWIKEKTSQAANWVKEKGKQVANWTKELVQEVKEITQPYVEKLGDTFIRWGDRIKNGFKKPKPKDYSPEITDIKAAQRAKQTIERKFPNGIRETLQEQNEVERIETFQDLAQEAIIDLQLDKTNLEVQIVPPQTEEEMSVFGYFSRTDNTLFINAEFIVSDDMDLAKEQVYTIYHELMHARQWAAVCAWASTPPGDTLGYSVDQILEFANNFAHYISPREGYEIYRFQPVENGAFGFESKLKEETN